MMIDPVLGCAALAIIELDASHVAQTLVSRPLAVAALLGSASGRPAEGALAGISIELLSLADLPVGGRLTWSATVAAGTAALLAARECALPASLLGGLLAGAFHARLEALERFRRSATADPLVERASTRPAVMGRALAASAAAHAAMTFAVSLFVVGAFENTAGHWARLPDFARAGAELAAACAPWVGLSGIAVWGFKRA